MPGMNTKTKVGFKDVGSTYCCQVGTPIGDNTFHQPDSGGEVGILLRKYEMI